MAGVLVKILFRKSIEGEFVDDNDGTVYFLFVFHVNAHLTSVQKLN